MLPFIQQINYLVVLLQLAFFNMGSDFTEGSLIVTVALGRQCFVYGKVGFASIVQAGLRFDYSLYLSY